MKYIQPIARMIECRLVTQGKLALLQLPAEWQHPTLKLEFNPDLKMREEYEKALKAKPFTIKPKVLSERCCGSPEQILAE
jgi:hypothetical protein